MIVISNTSPIFYLSSINHLDLLQQIYGNIIIPVTVFEEITDIGNTNISATLVPQLPWIQTQAVTHQTLVNRLRLELDKGEAEAIALALELNADRLIIDERLGRKKAKQLGISVIGVLGILIAAKQRNLIDAVKPLLHQLTEQTGFWLDSKLYREILQIVSEDS